MTYTVSSGTLNPSIPYYMKEAEHTAMDRSLCQKVKVHTLDIAPLRSESPPQKRSGMARVLKDLTVLPAHPTISRAG